MSILRFGKHKGKEIEEVETDYLDWLLGQNWALHLHDEILNILNRRVDWDERN